MARQPSVTHRTCRLKKYQDDPYWRSASTEEADSTMTRPITTSTATSASRRTKPAGCEPRPGPPREAASERPERAAPAEGPREPAEWLRAPAATAPARTAPTAQATRPAVAGGRRRATRGWLCPLPAPPARGEAERPDLAEGCRSTEARAAGCRPVAALLAPGPARPWRTRPAVTPRPPRAPAPPARPRSWRSPLPAPHRSGTSRRRRTQARVARHLRAGRHRPRPTQPPSSKSPAAPARRRRRQPPPRRRLRRWPPPTARGRRPP